VTGPNGERLCGACGESNPVRANFCLGCGAKLETAAEELGERRILTVLFADLSGFTAFSEGSDVEDVRALAKETADQLSDIVAHYGGTVDKIIGDCVMAVFGAPVAHEDDAERAVRAALDMQECVRTRRERFFGLALCVGVNTGEAIWSPVGPDGRYTVLGDTVNTAARLQGAANKGEILVGAETYEASAGSIDYVEVEPITAKNKAEPVPAWRAVDAKGARRVAAAVPLVGREAEVARVWELWELVRTTRSPYVATIVGDPGIGKSRLIRGITDKIGDDATLLTGRALAYGDGITYWPVIEMVKAAANINLDDSTDEASRKLGTFLEDLGSDDLDELRTMAVAMAHLIAAPTTPRGTYQATEITKGELHWGIRRVFQLAARRRPMALVFEDLHWAEDALIDLILSFVELEDDAPLLLVASGRPELADDKPTLFAPHKRNRTIELEALSTEESQELLERLVGTSAAADGALSELIARVAGNPLFLEETVRMLADADVLGEDGGVDAEKIDALSMPSSLRGLIGARLDRLPDVLKRTAGRASVMGQSFWSGAVAHMDGDDGEVTELLRELERHDVVQEMRTSSISGEREWTFRHGLIRDVVYDRIPKSERVRLHARCADWIAAGGDEFVEIIAYHLEQSCLIAREIARTTYAPPVLDAANALMRAGQKATSHEGAREAVRFFERALDLLQDAYPETAIELRLQMSRNLTAIGRYDDAYGEQQRVAEDAVDLSRPDIRIRALLSQAETDIVMGRVTEARAHVTEAEAAARDSDDLSIRILTMWQRAVLNELFDHEPVAAEENLRGALALAEEIEDHDLSLTLQMRLGALMFNVGKLGEAEVELARATTVAEARGSLRHLSWITAILGYVRSYRGPRNLAAEDLGKASDWLERTDDRHMRIQTLIWRADLELLAKEDVRKSVLYLRTALPLARAIGGQMVARVCRSLVDALVRQDRIGEARDYAQLASEVANEDDPYARAYAMVAEALISAAEGDDGGVRQRFAIARSLLEATPITLAEATLAEARALEAIGDSTGAADRLGEAKTLFESVGAVATVADIAADIERLSGRASSVVPIRRASSDS
jgi:class 3 adenylate cyclase/tetratricopeptide (TPR) repeat protein